MADVFNNPSNDYVYPALSPCAGAADESTLEFIKDGIGIISGSDILAKIDFSSIQIPVSSYSKDIRTLGPGEVIYIPGLTKGLQKREQGFTMPLLDSNSSSLNPYFLTLDFSINYYSNFKHYSINISVSSDYDQNISIEDALNIALGDLGIKATAIYDPSILIFEGDQDGYDFSVSNIILNVIDTSDNISSPFTPGLNPEDDLLEEDPDYNIPYAKYPNGAMQGVIMKGTYPNEPPYEKWLFINHVTDYVVIYTPEEIANFISEIVITFDPSIKFGPFLSDTSADYNGVTITGLSLSDKFFKDCSIDDSHIIDSSILRGNIFNSSWIERSVIEQTQINSYSSVLAERCLINESEINESTISNCDILDSSIFNSTLYDVSLMGCTLYNCDFQGLVTHDDNFRDIRINESINIDSIPLEPSTYYIKKIKRLDVGMNGSSTEEFMSAGDYLDWITTNNLWNRFGDLYIWTSASDAEGYKNLIDGFYIYNPHTFDCKVEYMIFV